MRIMMFLICTFLCYPIFAQSDISGKWLGTTTQNEGGYRTSYDFELYLHQDGSVITGRSYVYVEKIYAEMILKGKINKNGSVDIVETKLVDYKEFEGMEWCIKNMKLNLNSSTNTWTLEGNWEGNTSFGSCIPGKIYLKKIVPRA
jgi:hypothetical protein